jgi:hypothetical protein
VFGWVVGVAAWWVLTSTSSVGSIGSVSGRRGQTNLFSLGIVFINRSRSVFTGCMVLVLWEGEGGLWERVGKGRK